ncbi:MAG: KAP family NTPase [Shewanella xiamenensis]|nr:KAP family NTPase [Shewanella xiamenensis]
MDELDRCRPSYAVEMLETIKHIFNIDGVVFVVATDTEQLQHAVKAVYGEGFDAKIYLGRFFNSRYSLKSPNLENFLDVHSDANKLSEDYLKRVNIEIFPPNSDAKITLKNISIVLEAFNASPRTAIQITDRILATISNMPRGSKLDILMLTTLLCIKEKDNKLFEEIVNGKFERVIQKGDSTKIIYLSEWMESYIPKSSHNRLIEMNFDPQQYEDSQFTYGPYFRQTSIPYRSDTYCFNLLEYLNEIFSSHFGSSTTYLSDFLLIGGMTRRLEREDSPLQKLCKALIEEYQKPHTQGISLLQTSGLLWAKFLYIRNQFENIDMDEYKDFVELASPLDWMGQEDLTEIK